MYKYLQLLILIIVYPITELFTMLVADSESRGLLDKLSTEVKTDQQKINFLTLSAMYNEHIDEIENVHNLRVT